MDRRKYQKLIVWQEAMDLVVGVYRITERLPATERFGLCQQLRRAAVSIPSNIAEGAGRHSDKEFIRFLNIANGSLLEVETQLLIALQLQYIEEISELQNSIDKIFAMLSSLKRKLKTEY
ncbi:four helix bundle protein [Zhongshania aliphaticivorans]|uniref:Four helix bundle protein n=1 Tax=Zhongshania aliphaticivorans TaxID=1470434 RepID=A0A127M1B9_9GAMM|nr:four helix bundle protein [Zhongshania aliphaticivorans]AMO67023.1 four helix bundle protein [Zhongshania aliphaticivorans]